MTTFLLISGILATAAWATYWTSTKLTWWYFRRSMNGSDPLARAYAPQVAAVGQVAALAHAIVVAVVGLTIVTTGAAAAAIVGILAGAIVTGYERRRIREITE